MLTPYLFFFFFGELCGHTSVINDAILFNENFGTMTGDMRIVKCLQGCLWIYCDIKTPP